MRQPGRAASIGSPWTGHPLELDGDESPAESTDSPRTPKLLLAAQVDLDPTDAVSRLFPAFHSPTITNAAAKAHTAQKRTANCQP